MFSATSSDPIQDEEGHSSASSHNSNRLISHKWAREKHRTSQDWPQRTPSMTIAPAKEETGSSSIQCLRFKYFSTFFICTACLALLAASLATHKWLVSRPIRVLRLSNGLAPDSNLTALMLTAVESERPPPTASFMAGDQQSDPQTQGLPSRDLTVAISRPGEANELANKFQGRIYFGLFSGVKVLNYGFGDRVSQLSVAQPLSSAEDGKASLSGRHELVSFKSWLLTLAGVILASLFALTGAIFAIINFVIVPRGTVTGPVGLITWNAAACVACLLSILAWLVEYLGRLKWSVLSPEEVQNGWTSENRSQFGHSFYFVCLACLLHLANILIISAVHSETWTSVGHGETKRLSSPICDGVIMLY